MNIEIRKEKIATKTKWALAVAALVVSPVIFMIVKGLIGLAIAGTLGLAIISFAPVVAMKFANWRLKAIKSEAAANPIETMQNVWHEKQAAIEESAKRVEDFATEVMNFEGKLAGFRVEYPTEAPKFDSTYAAMLKLLEMRRGRLKQARDELARFDREINKANAIWKMGQAAAAMQKAAGMTDDSFLQKIKTETAIDSVQSNLNRAMAQLETALAEELPAIEHDPAPVIDVPAREINLGRTQIGVAR